MKKYLSLLFTLKYWQTQVIIYKTICQYNSILYWCFVGNYFFDLFRSNLLILQDTSVLLAPLLMWKSSVFLYYFKKVFFKSKMSFLSHCLAEFVNITYKRQQKTIFYYLLLHTRNIFRHTSTSFDKLPNSST